MAFEDELTLSKLAGVALLLLMLLILLDYAHSSGQLTLPHRRRPVRGQLVVITGAAGGLGRALALEFARRGAVLALWDVRASALQSLADFLVNQHRIPAETLHPREVDVTDAAAVAKAANALAAAIGPARVIVSNAGVVTGQRIMDSSEGSLRAAFNVNVLAHLWMVRAFVPHMLSNTSPTSLPCGTVVTVGSLMADLPAARLGDYCAGKAALAQLHECLRWELPQPQTRLVHVQPYMIDPEDSPLFDGGQPLRYHALRGVIPPLRASTVARRIIDAIEAGRDGPEHLVVPYIFKWLPPTLRLLPAFVRDVALYVAGADCAMDHWRGRREQR